MILPVILAGGSGTRLWPLSRALYPKQLISIVDQHTMLQNTILRLDGLDGVGDPVVICNDEYRFMVAEQLRQIGIKADSIILEPVGRNTAPALAVAAIRALDKGDDPVLLILPADHHIQFADKFQRVLKAGYEHAQAGRLITFGIVPEKPETGYGYIKMGGPLPSVSIDKSAVAIAAFVEKPDLETASQYVASKAYCWNSGMFMFNASQVLEELETFVPDIVASCRKAVKNGKSDLDFFRLDKAAFAACPSDSIDYAVMEKTENGAMVPMAAGWNDLGSWEALWQVGKKDDADNVVKGDVVLRDVGDSYLHAESRLIAAVGLKDHIVVETSDAVMISPRNRVQDVKGLVDELKAQNREETRTHKRVYRPWGTVDQLVAGTRFQVNRITVKSGGVLSLQKHFNRSEHWIVVKGSALVTKGDEQFVLKEDSSTYISTGIAHRLENPGKIPLEIIEVQTGSYFGEDDITRLEDLYGRHRKDYRL
ncbi:MAG: mannose-1-phosphate guanylyltransferase/mannose-6-phosphate isomerase [Desulfosarcina sp.]|nr:mannose-1-phosphate guanylyltransferase/mannose-6-phosphate isomerase [Desulfosarcina sp.]MBC2742781.1 mannose-1-phosphate guanylyltransferase/mannose-6-phosphate isomerase [Desulfosarcina sp.]MBC2765691.1 mannose-1-phosphate guanylyltransferase/mannose-6-phosphate isomerase [Desulfosarcina sp.]